MQDTLKDRFEKESFRDQQEPEIGHRDRFMDKLDIEMNHRPEGLQLNISYKFMRTAAAVAVLVTAISFAWFWDQSRALGTETESMTLASVSEKYKEVEYFYKDQMASRLAEIEIEDNEADKYVYNEALTKLNKLDIDYSSLEKDLAQNPGNTRIVYAMIQNYQLRITVLETLLQKLNIKETQKTDENEKASLYPVFPVGIHLVPFTA
jgi:hypothetical protein